MFILDPLDIKEADVTGSERRPLTPYLRQSHLDFGYLPNIRHLQPGDLILTSPRTPAQSAYGIRLFQRKQTGEQHEWTHAAIYVSDYTIIEANPFRGIHKSLLIDYVPSHRISFRRLKAANTGNSLADQIVGMKLALYAALSMPKSKYAYKHLAAIGTDFITRRTHQFRANYYTHQPHHICSSLFDQCARLAAGDAVVSAVQIANGLAVTPAILANVETLQDLQVGWAKLVS